MFGSSGGGGGGGGGVGGGGGNLKRGKGGGGTSSRNNHQAPQEMIHPVPVMASTQPMTHIQPFIQTFHQHGIPQIYAPIFHYMPPSSIHPGFPTPQTQYVFPRAPYTSSVPVNLPTLGPFGAIPQNLTPNHTSPSPLTPIRNSHGPIAVATGTSTALHAAPSSTSTAFKKRPYAIDIIHPETLKNVMEPWASSGTDDVKKEKPVEEKKKPEPENDSGNKVDCQMQTDVPVKIIRPVKNEEKEREKEKEKPSPENDKKKNNKNKYKKVQENENVQQSQQPVYEKVVISKPTKEEDKVPDEPNLNNEKEFKELCCTLSHGLNFIVNVEDLKPSVSVDSEIEGYCTDNELQTLIQEKTQNSTDVVLFSRKLNFQEVNVVNFTFGVSAKYRRYSLQEMRSLRPVNTGKPNLGVNIMKLVGRASPDDKKRSSSASKTLESKQMIRVNLSLKENIKLNESNDAWKPSIGDGSKPNDLQALVKKVRGFLNRLTEENFDTLSAEASKLSIQSSEEIENVMILVFEKAIGEPNFAHLYARFCHAIFTKTDQPAKKDNFITILVKHTEQEFASNVDNSNAIKAKLEPINEKLSNCTDDQQRAELKAELDEQEYLFRRRAWGTVRLIGELFNIDILKPRCVMECLQKLLDPKCEEKLEYLCKLLATVGKKLEKTPRGTPGQTYNVDLVKIFNAMQDIVTPVKKPKGKQNASIKLSSRVHFMLLDSIDLKKNQWQKGCILSPSILMRKQVTSELESKFQKQMKPNKIVQIKPKTNFPTLLQSNDRSKKSIPFDSSKLNFNTDGDFQLGNSSQFMWRNVAGSTVNSTQNVSTNIKKEEEEEDDDDDEVEKDNIVPSIVVTEVFQITPIDDEVDWMKVCQELSEAFLSKNHMECMKIWQEKLKNPHHHNHIIFYILSEYLISDLVNSQRETIAKVLIELHRTKCISLEQIQSGFNQFKELANDLFLDVPLLWQCLFHFISPFLQEEVIKFEYIWSKEWSSTVLAEKFLLALISYFTNEYGPKHIRNLWKKLNLNWNQFFKTPDEAAVFIEVNQLGFITNENSILPDSMFKRSYEDVGCSIKRLIIVDNKNLDHVVDFVNGNVKVINSKFINVLTQSLCDAAAVINNSSLDDNIFVERCIPILRRYIDVNEEYEMECIRAIDTFVKNYEHPQYLLSEIKHNLTEHELISEETLKKWRELP